MKQGQAARTEASLKLKEISAIRIRLQLAYDGRGRQRFDVGI